jgi:hypothetical protein
MYIFCPPPPFLPFLTALLGLGLLIFEALWSHPCVDYTGLLDTLATSEFTNFKLAGIYIRTYATKAF